MRYAVVLGCSLGAITACSDDSPEGPGPRDGGPDGAVADPDAGGGDGAPDADMADTEGQLEGRFAISLIEADPSSGAPALSRMQGTVRDRPAPAWMGWRLAEEIGPCRLETPDFPFCDPECGAGWACVAGDICQPDPQPVDVGDVTVTGLSRRGGESDAIELSKIGPTYQPSGSVDLAYPPTEEGAEIRLSATGGAYPRFEVTSTGIAPLEVLGGDSLPFDRDQVLALRWEPASSPDSTVSVLVDISHHGGVKGRIVCEGDDSAGELEVSDQLVSKLIDLGVAGFPIVRLSRTATGSTTVGAGRVELTVGQTREIALEIPGLSSCLQAADCPDGETCRADRTCG